MTATLFRLLALVALMLMPIGMGAPALGQSMPAEHTIAAMGHCDGQPDQDKAPVSAMDCAAMCTALPAAHAPTVTRVVSPSVPCAVVLATPFLGIDPELATPPPKRA